MLRNITIPVSIPLFYENCQYFVFVPTAEKLAYYGAFIAQEQEYAFKIAKQLGGIVIPNKCVDFTKVVSKKQNDK